MLVRGGSPLLRRVDPALRLFIDLRHLVLCVFNSLAVTVGLFANLI
jgi:hypothetical protein